MARPSTSSKPAGDPEPRRIRLDGLRAFALPLLFALVLAAFGLVPSVQQHPRQLWSILGAAAALAAGALILGARAGGRVLTLSVALRAQHYMQACAQSAVLLYWGWYWQPVYEALPLIGAQLAFAFALDMLLAWSRRDHYTLGFGPFPVIFSINLFLWFKPDWFYLQFLMIALGFAAKELIRWDKEGRRAHIFNPSSFPLAVFSIGLIVTGTTSWTWGVEIARTQFGPPNIYLFLFLVGLPGQLLFGVTTMTMSAVVTTYLFGLLYFAFTGTYFFIDSYIPVAVFLGMHLLFTDPSTSPRTELGRIIFGMTYGLSNVALYALLGQAGIPSFYDKLLPVPIMNLSIKLIDRFARSLKRFDPARLGASLSPRRRNLAYMTIWSAVFIVLSSVDGVGDNHPGHRVPFWQQACQDGRPGACATLSLIAATYCQGGSGWACNELGVLRTEQKLEPAESIAADFSRSCELGFSVGCQNMVMLDADTGTARRAPPQVTDYPVILRAGKGTQSERTPFELVTRACDHGWMEGCQRLAFAHLRGEGTTRDASRAAEAFERACAGGLAAACSDLGFMYRSADGVLKDEEKALGYLKRACDLGFPAACQWLREESR